MSILKKAKISNSCGIHKLCDPTDQCCNKNLTAIMKQISDDFLVVNKVMIGSDSTRYLSSHESLPYIHKLNETMKIIRVGR